MTVSKPREKNRVRHLRTHPLRRLALFGLLGLLGPALALALPLSAARANSVESELSFHRGVVAYGQGRYGDAKRLFEVVIAAEPEDAPALQYLGLIAQAQDDPDAAVEYLRRAVRAEPDDAAMRVDLATALLGADRAEEAMAELDAVLAKEPERARAQLYAGVADYRQRSYSDAIGHFQRAQELDPALRLQSRYYIGLCQAFLGDLSSSSGAFADAEEASPSHPLGRSARSLRGQLEPSSQRPWQLSAAVGIEGDSNPTVVGTVPLATGALLKERPDLRGVFRLDGELNAYQGDHLSIDAGYDGYLSLHSKERVQPVDQNTQVGWASSYWLFDPVRFGVRYDFAYTWLDLSDRFRRLHRVVPSLSFREGDWGVSQLLFEYQNLEYFEGNGPLNRDGDQFSVGANQFFFLPPPLTFARLGLLWNTLATDGNEFDFDGVEVSGGIGAALPADIGVSLLYIYAHRDYDNLSEFALGGPTVREDNEHRISVEFTLPFLEHFEAALAGTFIWNGSNVAAFDYDRQVGGAYLRYHF